MEFAPTLEIIDVYPNMATVSVQCIMDLGTKHIAYHIRYREFGSNDEWTESVIESVMEGSPGELILLGLTTNTKYEAYAVFMYLNMNTEVWSQESSLKEFITRDERARAAVVFEYWLRTTSSANNISAYDLLDVMMRYFFDGNYFSDTSE